MTLTCVSAAITCCGQSTPDGEKVIDIELGAVAQGTSISEEIVFSRPVDTAVALCECLSFVIRKDGEGDVVTVTFDSRGYMGDTLQELIVLSGQDKTRLRFHALVR